MGAANSPLALYLDVDFEIEDLRITLEKEYLDALKSGKIAENEIHGLMRRQNNVATEYRITMRVVK